MTSFDTEIRRYTATCMCVNPNGNPVQISAHLHTKAGAETLVHEPLKRELLGAIKEQGGPWGWHIGIVDFDSMEWPFKQDTERREVKVYPKVKSNE